MLILKFIAVENQQGFFSRKLRAGKKRSYFFDVRSTKQGDYFVTITESKRRYDRPGYDSHKIFLYKEDFKTFQNNLDETLNHIKTELNPEFDYENYDREVYSKQVELEKASQPEKKVESKAKSNSGKIESVRDGDYLKDYEGKEITKKEIDDTYNEAPTDDGAMNW